MQIADLLKRAHDGDAEALNAVTPLVYQELKQLAMGHLRHQQAPAAIEATALVHEAFLRLAGSPLPEFENRSHFYGIAARVMRQILVDMARARYAGNCAQEVQFTVSGFEKLGAPPGGSFLVLNDALDRLIREHPLKGKLIEWRFFAGVTPEESALALHMSVHDVRRQISLALAWLRRELAGNRA